MTSPTSRHSGPRAARAVSIASAVFLIGVLAGCSASVPVRWVHLPLAPSSPLQDAPTTPRVATVTPTVQLMPLRLPDLLDRDEILVPAGPARLTPLAGWRWAEPLREAVPRLLRDDLARALGESRLWTGAGPVASGREAPLQLRVEVVALQVDANGQGVRLRARWSLVDPGGRQPARSGVHDATQPAGTQGEPAERLATAHRDAVAALATSLASVLASAPAPAPGR